MPTNPTILHTLNSAALSDTLDSLGLMQQAMEPFVRPLDDRLQLIGRARTGLYMPVYVLPAAGENPTRSKSRSSMDSRPERRSCWLATVRPSALSLGRICSPPRAWRVVRPDA